MSAAAEEPEEPDLTALLDLVLQLVMFFLAVARIDNEMRDQSVILPQASIARSLTKDYNRIVIVNLYPASTKSDEERPRANGSNVKYSLFEGYTVREYTSLINIKDALKDKFEADKKATSAPDWETGRGRSLIVLRAHKDCTFKQVHGLMTTAREVGYSEIQLRAYVAGASER